MAPKRSPIACARGYHGDVNPATLSLLRCLCLASATLLAIACGRLSFDPIVEQDVVCAYPPPGACEPIDLGSTLGISAAIGTTTGASNQQPSCDSGQAPEQAFIWTAPETGVYTFDTAGSGFDTVLHARLGWCEGPEIACNDNLSDNQQASQLTLSAAAGDRIVLFVDGNDENEAGEFALNIIGNEVARCGDGRDNDLDGAVDCMDPDCASALRCQESGFCRDGIDNDGDANADCADADCACDRGCATICDATPLDGLGSPLTSINHDGACSGLLSASCMPAGAVIRTYRWSPPGRGRYRIDTSGSSRKTGLSVHVGDCAGPELACNAHGAVLFDLSGEDDVFILVGADPLESGDVSLNIARSEVGYCLDGLDNDEDGKPDCLDEDCKDRAVCSEIGHCNDMQDNDLDGQTDCEDADCENEPVCMGVGVVSCPTFELGTATGDAIGLGETVSAGQYVDADCVDASGPEISFKWTSPATGQYRFSLDGSDYDTVIHVRYGACTGPEIACADNDGDVVHLPVQAGESVIVFGDSHEDGAGQVTLNVQPSEYGSCFDGLDNDGDMAIDCQDSDCEGVPVCGESARCDDQLDNDGDGDTDCDDSECACDPACVQRQCPDVDLGSAVGPAVATGTTDDGRSCGAFQASCKDSYAPERTFAWTAPVTGTYRFDTEGSDLKNVVYLLPSTCEGLELGCKISDGDQPASIERDIEAGTALVIVVDGQHGSKGDFVLNITGSESGQCGDGRDNDIDGDVDCFDSDCADSPFCCDGVACICQPPEDPTEPMPEPMPPDTARS